MVFSVNIAKNFRLIFTAITLLFVVGLNNREVTTYAAPKAKTTQHVNNTAAQTHGILKQKVSLEATTSYVILQLAICADFIRYTFTNPICKVNTSYTLISAVTGFFSVLLATTIQPNAP